MSADVYGADSLPEQRREALYAAAEQLDASKNGSSAAAPGSLKEKATNQALKALGLKKPKNAKDAIELGLNVVTPGAGTAFRILTSKWFWIAIAFAGLLLFSAFVQPTLDEIKKSCEAIGTETCLSLTKEALKKNFENRAIKVKKESL